MPMIFIPTNNLRGVIQVQLRSMELDREKLRRNTLPPKLFVMSVHATIIGMRSAGTDKLRKTTQSSHRTTYLSTPLHTIGREKKPEDTLCTLDQSYVLFVKNFGFIDQHVVLRLHINCWIHKINYYKAMTSTHAFIANHLLNRNPRCSQPASVTIV